MTAPFGALGPALAVVLALVAVVTGPNYAVSVPAAVLAIGAAGFTLYDAVRRSARGRPPGRGPTPRPELFGARAWLQQGTVGREEIVLLVDRLDRAADRPELPVRTPAEVEEVVHLPDPEFRAWVNGRLDAIEGES